MTSKEVLERYSNRTTLPTKDLVRLLIAMRNYTYELLGQKLNITQQNISRQINSTKDMTLSRFMAYMDALDCDVIVRSRTKDHREWTVQTVDDSWAAHTVHR